MSVLRIWNLRRGDDDDNRSSPYGRGFRSLVLSAVFELNYLKAPIGFFALVALPALLVGIAPSIVVTYGRMFYQTTAVADTSIIFALALLAVLLGVALWIGRPLLKAAFARLRHLHFALVLPIFVALRELLVTIVELVAGASATQEQLSSRRRISTILAALLFAGAGLTLAATVELSIGLKLVTGDEVRFGPALKAALGNAVIIIGISTVFEAIYWAWLEFGSGDPVVDWTPNVLPAAFSRLRVAHLSDLHVVGDRYGYRMESGTLGPRGNRSFRNALRKLVAIHDATPVDRILVTGDVTDAGTRAEWAEFLDLLRMYPTLRSRLSFVPGNHDVNIVDRTNPARLDLPWSSGLALRKLRVVVALDDIQGHRARLVDRSSGTLGPTLKDYLREGRRWKLLRELAQQGTMRGRREVAKTWTAIFPLVEIAPDGEGYGLILLDSNAPSHFSLTNAIGVIHPSHLDALKAILRNYSGRSWIILMHHQVVEYPVASINLRDRIGLALVNASDLLAAIAPHASRVVILHGHRHRDWIGARGDVLLCSAPSVALGSDIEKYRGSFHVHELALWDEGIRLMTTHRVRVS